MLAATDEVARMIFDHESYHGGGGECRLPFHPWDHECVYLLLFPSVISYLILNTKAGFVSKQ